MARASDKESSYSPKHRILGAIILVSLAVIFLPMILSPDRPPPPPSGIGNLGEMPEPETQVFRMPAASLADDESTRSKDVAAAVPETARRQQDSGMTKPAISMAKTDADNRKGTRSTIGVQQTTADSSANKTPQKDAPAAKGADNAATKNKVDGWVVQVGTFSDSENAKRLRDKLQKNGFLVNLQDVELKGRKVVRVRVGPYRQKHVAMDARSRIEKEVGLEGVVIAYP